MVPVADNEALRPCSALWACRGSEAGLTVYHSVLWFSIGTSSTRGAVIAALTTPVPMPALMAAASACSSGIRSTKSPDGGIHLAVCVHAVLTLGLDGTEVG